MFGEQPHTARKTFTTRCSMHRPGTTPLPRWMRAFALTCARNMRAVDTNVLVRLIVRDDPEQARQAEAVWVLASVYDVNVTGIDDVSRL